jgi:hypothetical protein
MFAFVSESSQIDQDVYDGLMKPSAARRWCGPGRSFTSA